jgi:hypothetical protein
VIQFSFHSICIGGKYTDLYTEPGCYFKNCWGRELRRVSKQKTSINLPNVKILDLNGNPLHVSGIVVYSFERTKRVAIDMLNAASYIENQSLAVLKQIVSRYPYEHWEEGDHEDCLKTSGEKIQNELVRALQKQVAVAGAKVHTFQLNEISYSPGSLSYFFRSNRGMISEGETSRSRPR